MKVFSDSQQTFAFPKRVFANRGRIFLVSIFGGFSETMDIYVLSVLKFICFYFVKNFTQSVVERPVVY